MNDINATLGLAQLGKLDKSNKKRCQLASRYTNALRKLTEVECPTIKHGMISAQHNYVIRCHDRDRLRLFLKERNISSGVHYMPLHLHPFYKKLYPKTTLPVTETEWQKLLTLPLYPQLAHKDQDYIIKCIKEFYKR
jgi:perosamine synthetase